MLEAESRESTSELRQEAQLAEAMRGGRSATTPDAPIVARVVRRYRARVFQGYVIAATVGFAALLILARHAAYFSFDVSIAQFVQSWHALWLDVVMFAVSGLGFNPLAWVFVVSTIPFVYVVGLKWEATMLLFAGVGVGLLSDGVKIIVQRQRPTPDLVNVFSPLADYSFPSGHVMLFTVFLGFLLFLVYTLTPRSSMRTCGLCLLAVLIALVGVSRVYLGQHWPSDVIGAYLLGSLWLAVTIFVYRKGKSHFFTHQPLAPGKPVAVK
jgi:undecaprenyl-diphosphatase